MALKMKGTSSKAEAHRIMRSYTKESDPVRYQRFQEMLEATVNVSGSLNDKLDAAFDELWTEFEASQPKPAQ